MIRFMLIKPVIFKLRDGFALNEIKMSSECLDSHKTKGAARSVLISALTSAGMSPKGSNNTHKQ